MIIKWKSTVVVWVAAVPKFPSLAWELPCALGAAENKAKKTKPQKTKTNKKQPWTTTIYLRNDQNPEH